MNKFTIDRMSSAKKSSLTKAGDWTLANQERSPEPMFSEFLAQQVDAALRPSPRRARTDLAKGPSDSPIPAGLD